MSIALTYQCPPYFLVSPHPPSALTMNRLIIAFSGSLVKVFSFYGYVYTDSTSLNTKVELQAIIGDLVYYLDIGGDPTVKLSY